MVEVLREVFAAMSGNKMRIIVTGFSVGWGIFILILLIGSGNGMINGLKDSFYADTTNILHVTPSTTQLTYNGMPKGRHILVRHDDLEYVKAQMADCISKILYQTQSEHVTASYTNHHIDTNIVGISTNSLFYESEKIIKGRDILPQDEKEGRPVCLLCKWTIPILFPNNEDPIGKWVTIGKTAFMVIGIYSGMEMDYKSHTVYAPAKTVQDIFNPEGGYSKFSIIAKGVKSQEEYKAYKERLNKILGARLNFDSKDAAAVIYEGYFEQYIQFYSIFNIIRFFVWFTGIATLIAGIVGVSNIMLISVRERTRELGVRKAMGASNMSIIRLVLTESVIISLIFGYIGMILGIGVTQFMTAVLASGNVDTIFVHPTVSLSVVIVANIIMALAGLAAGYIPARHAVKIRLIEALSA